MVNYIDNDVTIKYIEYQALDFNDTRIAGNDPLEADLTTTSYYCYLITGLDYDSYSLKGSYEFYAKARSVNNREHKLVYRLETSKNQRNRYWLIDQTLNSRFSEMRTVFYNYHS